MLDNAALGELGGDYFKLKCAEADLVCNKSLQDMTGWDYLVDFKFDKQDGPVPLDGRKRPISCHVQVKTVRDNSQTIKVLLSSAEYLAKEPKPSFFYILKVDHSDRPIAAFIIHVLNEPLGKILKRLRKEGVAGNKINKMYISFPIKGAVCIDLTGQSARLALEEMCGLDTQKYIAEKAKQLKTLGYETRPFQGKFSMKNMDIEDIVDVGLGLKQGVPVENFEQSEIRFGIKVLQNNYASGALISIVPSPIAECRIIIRHASLTEPSFFNANAFLPAFPGIPKDKRKILVKSEFITIEAKKNEWSITLQPPSEAAYTLQGWENYWRAHLIFGKGDGTVEISGAGTSSFITLDRPMDGITDTDRCHKILERIQHLEKLFRSAGRADHQVTMDEIAECDSIRTMCLEEVTQFEGMDLKMPLHPELKGERGKNILIISAASFGTFKLIHIGIAEINLLATSEAMKFEFVRVIPREVKMIENSDECFALAQETAMKTYGIQWAIKVDPKGTARST